MGVCVDQAGDHNRTLAVLAKVGLRLLVPRRQDLRYFALIVDHQGCETLNLAILADRDPFHIVDQNIGMERRGDRDTKGGGKQFEFHFKRSRLDSECPR